MLRYDSLQEASLNADPYPYLILESAFEEDQLRQILNDFPAIKHPGSIPYDAVESGVSFKALIDELNSDKFRNAIETKFKVDLTDCPTMFTVRGVMRQKDRRIHTDSKTKVITVLFYFNDGWQEDGGYLRLLADST